MKKQLFLLVVSFCCLAGFAAGISEEQTRLAAEMMQVMRAEAQLKNSLAMVRNMQRQMVPKMLEQQGIKLSAEEQKQQEKLLGRAMAIVEEELSWAKLGPLMTEAYAATFTEEQLKELITFFKSPIGQAFLDKTPVLQQKLMAGMQEISLRMQKRLVEELKKEVADLQAEEPETSPAK